MSMILNWWRVAILLTAVSNSLSAGVSVEFDDLSEFKDFTINGLFNQESARDLFSMNLQTFWNDTMQREVPDNTSLELTFHEIDMAGEMQPVPRFGQAYSRVISPNFPPVLKFSYRILDSSGNVLAHGDESLLGKEFQFRYRGTAPAGRRTFFYEFAMLSNWLKQVPLAGDQGLVKDN